MSNEITFKKKGDNVELHLHGQRSCTMNIKTRKVWGATKYMEQLRNHVDEKYPPVDPEKAQHTAGEWQAVEHGVISDKITSYGNFYVCSSIDPDNEEHKANMKLIAAAPKGLRLAMKLYVKLLMTPSELWRAQNQDSYVDLREYISLATGWNAQYTQETFEGIAMEVKYKGANIDVAINKATESKSRNHANWKPSNFSQREPT